MWNWGKIDQIWKKKSFPVLHFSSFVRCNVIKQNESELANTVFKIQPNKPIASFVSYCLFTLSTVCIFGTNCPISVGFSPNSSLNNTLIENAKKRKSYFSTWDSFCLIASHISKNTWYDTECCLIGYSIWKTHTCFTASLSKRSVIFKFIDMLSSTIWNSNLAV